MLQRHAASVLASPGQKGVSCFLALMLIGSAVLAGAAPEYVLSGQAPALAKVILAETPAGQVNALDLLMFDSLTDNSLAWVPMDIWIHLDAPQAKLPLLAINSNVERFVAYRSLAKRAGDWRPPETQLRVGSFGAAAAVWVERVVKPEIKVLDKDIDRCYLAHPEKHLRRQRAHVRTIFMKATMTDSQDKLRVREKLEDLAKQIQGGKLRFEEAARKFSEAPSAAQGGLIPEFLNGSHFQTFEERTFDLEKPGQLSPVFEGPEGFYLVQLVQIWPPRNIPIGEVREELRAQLGLEHVRHYFNYLIARLNDKHLIQNNSYLWTWLNPDAPIARLDKAVLTRNDFLRFYGNPTNTNYDAQIFQVLGGAAAWVQGEAIMGDLAARGAANDPWILRQRQLAELPPKVQRVYAREVPADTYRTTETAIKAVTANKQFMQNLRSCRLIRIETTIKSPEKFILDEDRLAAEALAQTLTTQVMQGVLAVEPAPIKLEEWRRTALAVKDEQLTSTLNVLNDALKAAKWPNVRVRMSDFGWQAPLPGTPWQALLKNQKEGQVTQPQRIANQFVQYLILAERPVDPKLWETQPFLLRTMAFQLEAARIFHQEVERVRQSGGIKYKYQ